MTKTSGREIIERQIKKYGLQMLKQISSGGLFSSPTYDRRTVYSLKDLDKLNAEGFNATEDLAAFVFNALMDD